MRFQDLDAITSSGPLTEAVMTLGDGIDPEHAYEVFKHSYEDATGASWTAEKFFQRARNWTFYGNEDGFVAIRSQRSGPLKLVGAAGSPRGVAAGLAELQATGAPIWGAVSAPLAKMAQKRGMVVPHTLPGGAMLVRALVSSVPASVFGGVTPTVLPDGGLALDYDDTGRAEKYLIGNRAYFSHAIGLQHVADALRSIPGAKFALRAFGLKLPSSD